jgi:hypothetical protein
MTDLDAAKKRLSELKEAENASIIAKVEAEKAETLAKIQEATLVSRRMEIAALFEAATKREAETKAKAAKLDARKQELDAKAADIETKRHKHNEAAAYLSKLLKAAYKMYWDEDEVAEQKRQYQEIQRKLEGTPLTLFH